MKKIVLISFLFLICLSGRVNAQEICPLNGQPMKPKGIKSLEQFRHLAIMDNGRLKPLETYAQNLLLQFSGKRTFDRKPAIQWLAKFLFSPDLTRDDQIFLINNPEIAAALNIEAQEKRRYSFSQLEPGYEKLTQLAAAAAHIEEKDRSLVENELVRVLENVNLYTNLSRSFLFAFPHPDFTVTNTQLAKELDFSTRVQQFSFIDVALQADRLYQLSSPLQNKDQSEWSAEDKELLQLMGSLYQWSSLYRDLPFAILPPYKEESENWLSPWDALANGFLQDQSGRDELSTLRTMMIAYWNGQQLEFDLATKTLSKSIEKRVNSRTAATLHKLPLELLYNQLNLFFWAKFLYGIVFLIFLFSLINEKKYFHTVSVWLIGLGFAMHLSGVILRCIILARPPVSTLYETFVFVGLVSVFLGIILERVNKEWLGILISSIGGFCLLLLASKFSADGDTLKMLVAVLNSNFWLSTHVLSITSGYAGCSVAGLVGHVYIVQALLRSQDHKKLDKIHRNLIGILGFGLIMTFLGTNLGGIWADQSWGRFWGWDPKENGALLIILWTAIIFHLRIGKMISALGTAFYSVLGMLVVMWAWFGVNLLSVGLHSYGFTHGTAIGLGIYAVSEIVFLAVATPILIKRGLKF